MTQLEGTSLQHKKYPRLALPIRISLWLIAAALLPLLITITISEWYSRPTLLNQAQTAMESDARTHAQLINNYFTDRLKDVVSLAQVPLAQQLFQDPTNSNLKALVIQNGKVVAANLDPNYTIWSLFNLQGQPLLSYTSNGNINSSPTSTAIPPQYQSQLQTGEPFISEVAYDPVIKKASVDLYVISYALPEKRPLGIVRATLTLDTIWNTVNSENGANGNGSYAMILDKHGVRIADPQDSHLFTAIAPLDSQTQLLITAEQRYGSSKNVPVIADNDLNQKLQQSHAPLTFEIQPAGQQGSFQVTRQNLSAVPWTYLVFSPVNTVFLVANQQLIITLLAAIGVLILAAIIGLAVGRRIAAPILEAVIALQESSEALAILAARQQNAAAEQVWVVDSSQIGLKAVQYYTKATEAAADQVNKIGQELQKSQFQVDQMQIMHSIELILSATRYIKKAVHYQHDSNEKLSIAINVTNQVSEQLASGSISAMEASTRLKTIVTNLQQTVSG